MIASVPKELIEILHSPIPFLVGMIDQEELIPKNIIICKVSKQNVKIMNLEEEKMIVESNQFKKLM